MKRFLPLAFTFFFIYFSSCMEQGSRTSSSTKGVFINLTSDITTSSHSALMGLHVAQKALRNDMDATVFVNVDAVSIFAPGAEARICHGENLHEVLNDIMEKGGKVTCCPHCLSSAGLNEKDLMQGATLSQEDDLISSISSNITCLTY